jgi:general secretion pathway protein H
MVVVLILGVASGMAVLSIGDGGRDARLDREAERLRQGLQLASEEAIVRGRSIGLGINGDSYEYCLRANGGWQPLSRPLDRHRLPAGLRLEFAAGGPESGGAVPPPACPGIVYRPSGENDPFTLILTDLESGGRRQLTVTLFGAPTAVAGTSP